MSHYFPPEEAAPTLGLYSADSLPTPVHVSTLIPHADAKMELNMWARLHYQMLYVDSGSLESLQASTNDNKEAATRPERLLGKAVATMGFAETADMSIITIFPKVDEFGDDERSTWLRMTMRNFLIGEAVGSCAMHNTRVILDLSKPGVVQVEDKHFFEADADFSIPGTRFTPSANPTERWTTHRPTDTAPGLIAVRENDYVIGNEGAQEIINLLRTAHAVVDIQASDDREDALWERCSKELHTIESLYVEL